MCLMLEHEVLGTKLEMRENVTIAFPILIWDIIHIISS